MGNKKLVKTALTTLCPPTLVPSHPPSLVPFCPGTLTPSYPCTLLPLCLPTLSPLLPALMPLHPPTLVPLLPPALAPFHPCALAPSHPCSLVPSRPCAQRATSWNFHCLIFRLNVIICSALLRLNNSSCIIGSKWSLTVGKISYKHLDICIAL